MGKFKEMDLLRQEQEREAPVQEPVDWQFFDKGCWWNSDHRIKNQKKDMELAGYKTRDLYTTPPSAQPAPVKTDHDGKPWPVAPVPNGPYSAPIKELWPVAPKPWVGLTDDEIRQCETTNSRSYIVHARAIEAKLREKNGGAA